MWRRRRAWPSQCTSAVYSNTLRRSCIGMAFGPKKINAPALGHRRLLSLLDRLAWPTRWNARAPYRLCIFCAWTGLDPLPTPIIITYYRRNVTVSMAHRQTDRQTDSLAYAHRRLAHALSAPASNLIYLFLRSLALCGAVPSVFFLRPRSNAAFTFTVIRPALSSLRLLSFCVSLGLVAHTPNIEHCSFHRHPRHRPTSPSTPRRKYARTFCTYIPSHRTVLVLPDKNIDNLGGSVLRTRSRLSSRRTYAQLARHRPSFSEHSSLTRSRVTRVREYARTPHVHYTPLSPEASHPTLLALVLVPVLHTHG
ncbi:hypothetical protein MVEN_01843800 [Mycena venus]|uniref:Uncharacterized protein n=1 Tax=Mycena venus TaxID=2733690 RepID=A0A8H7CM47_9AGAR|nr:hypothetical protein MVEN_01843800 [Mycena venus]